MDISFGSCIKLTLFYIFITICVTSCVKKKRPEDNVVIIRSKKYPNTLNYLLSTSGVETDLQKKIFNRLFWYNEESKLEPLLVKSLPHVEKTGNTFVLSYRVRDEAFWDDKEPITAKDILFSLKAYKLPITNNVRTKIYLERIKNAIIDSLDNKSISFYAEGNLRDITNLTGDFDILQKSKYDSEGLLDGILIEDIENYPEKIAANKGVKKFVNEFLKDNFKFKGEYFNGSGPYEIVSMEQGKYIRLKKKTDWWGEGLVGKLPQFHANVGEIVYLCIPEPLVAIQALKSYNIDVMDDIPSNEFAKLEKDSLFTQTFNLFSPLKYKFTYIGFNSRIKYLNNINIRMALAYLIKVQDMIKVVERGYGQRTIGPINPVNKYFYNDKISLRNYDLKRSQELFLNNGFELTKGKLVDEITKEPLEFNLSYRQNPNYESIAFLLKQEASKIGIKLNLKQYEGRTMSKMARNHEFEIMVGAFSGNPYSLNFSGLFNQEAARVGGMNFTGFGNTRSDSLIQAANHAEDSVSKKQALYALQEELHEEATMLFLYFSKNKIAINKKFTNLKISTTKPGYDVTSFILKNPSNSN